MWLYVAQCGLQIREANFIWTHDRANPSQLQNEKAVWSESIPEAWMESFSQKPVPFAALTVLECDGKRTWTSSVDWPCLWKKGTVDERGTVDGKMKWPATVLAHAGLCTCKWCELDSQSLTQKLPLVRWSWVFGICCQLICEILYISADEPHPLSSRTAMAAIWGGAKSRTFEINFV